MYRHLIQQGSTIVQYTHKYTSTPLTLAPEFLRQYENIKFYFLMELKCDLYFYDLNMLWLLMQKID